VTHSPLIRLGMASLGLGGVLRAASLLISAGNFTGATLMLSSRWILAHNAMFVGAALLLFGAVSLYQAQWSDLPSLGHVAFVLALMGCAFAFGEAEITAGVFPFVAAADSRLMAASSLMFHPPLPAIRMGAVMFGFGWMVFGLATALARVFPVWTGIAIAAGAILESLVPRPLGSFPWVLQAAGAAIMAVAFVVVGWLGWTMHDAIRLPLRRKVEAQ